MSVFKKCMMSQWGRGGSDDGQAAHEVWKETRTKTKKKFTSLVFKKIY